MKRAVGLDDFAGREVDQIIADAMLFIVGLFIQPGNGRRGQIGIAAVSRNPGQFV